MTTFDASSGRVAALRRWAVIGDRTQATTKAREGRLARYLAKVDPDGKLNQADRERRAQSLLRADMIELARKRWAKTS